MSQLLSGSLWRRIAAVSLPVTPKPYRVGETAFMGSQLPRNSTSYTATAATAAPPSEAQGWMSLRQERTHADRRSRSPTANALASLGPRLARDFRTYLISRLNGAHEQFSEFATRSRVQFWEPPSVGRSILISAKSSAGVVFFPILRSLFWKIVPCTLALVLNSSPERDNSSSA